MGIAAHLRRDYAIVRTSREESLTMGASGAIHKIHVCADLRLQIFSMNMNFFCILFMIAIECKSYLFVCLTNCVQYRRYFLSAVDGTFVRIVVIIYQFLTKTDITDTKVVILRIAL